MAFTMMKALVVVLVIMACFPSGSRAACGDYAVCSTCVVDRNCGWCLGDGVAQCMAGDASGPSTLPNKCTGAWQYEHSQVVSSTAGFPVSPGDSYFGLTSFIEKPIHPVGQTSKNSDGSPTNYVYKLHTSLTNDYNQLLQAVTSVTTTGNIDWCECSLDGMTYTMLDPAAGWRSDSQKVMVLATDACFHQQGDFTRKSPYAKTNCDNPYDECCYYPDPDTYPGGHCPFSLPPNNLDMVFDIYDSSKKGLNLPGSGEDYVSIDQFKTLLLKKNIVPIFAITDTQASPQQEYQVFSDLLAYVGFGGIYPLSSDSSNLVQAIVSTLDVLSRTVTMGVATDDYSYVQSFYPTTYTNVDVTQVQNFNVTLLASASPVHDTTIQLSVLGFGTVYINVLSKLPCAGCDGVANSNSYTDKCGVCNGNNACADCAGQPYGSAVLDVCNVCGGKGDTCLGCDRVPFSGLTFDACGVCGGKNECVGCDGVPRSQPYVKDLCGVCGGNDSCLDCASVPFGNLTLDACGVCGGKNACIGCDGKLSYPPKVNDTCGVCGGNDGCYDCFGVKNGTAVYDLCGVCNGNNSCRSCDGTYDPTNKKVNDSCGVCGGDGKSCAGCDGIANSNETYDLCGICGGSNSCLGCDNVPNSGATVQCGVCGGNTSCIGCDNVQFSGKQWDKCGECGGNNTCLGCDGKPYSGKTYDICYICGGDGTSCLGCDGVANSSKIVDNCGVCGGTNGCLGCDEIPFSGVIFDRCKVCGGNSSCLGCDGVPFSGLEYDDCGVCPNVKNYTYNACAGCDGVPYSGLKNDSCGVCNGDNACVGCDGVPYSGITADECGVCPTVQNYTENGCFGCDKKPNSGLIFDLCGVCDGNNTCVGCDGKVNSTAQKDLCGICEGNNTCLGCDLVPNSGAIKGIRFEVMALFSVTNKDICGDCGGNSSRCLSGCDNQPFSTAKVDTCGVCKGDNSTCKPGQPWFLQTRTITIAAGTIGGTLVGVAALVAGLFLYKRLTAGAYWYIPKDLLDSTTSVVAENPLFESSGTGFAENPLFAND